MVSASAAPYGYTITVWSSGAVLIHFRHLSTVWESFLFVASAVGAFAVLWLVPFSAVSGEGFWRFVRWRLGVRVVWCVRDGMLLWQHRVDAGGFAVR